MIRRIDPVLLLLAAFALLVAVTGDHGFILPDEVWFIRVVQRVLHGDVLYRDIGYPATPLPVLIAVPLAKLLGPGLALGRLLTSACFLATGVVGLRVMNSLGQRNRASHWVFALGLCVFAHPSGLTALYSGLSYLFLLACLAIVLAMPGKRTAWLAGLCAGLAFSSKYTIGTYTLLALFVVLLTSHSDWRARLRDTISATAAFCGTVLVILLPVVWFSGSRAFWECTVEDKAGYIRLAGIPLWKGMREWFQLLTSYGTHTVGEMSTLYWRLVFFLPLLALLSALGAAIVNPDKRRRCAILSAFLAAAGLGLYPLGDEVHYLLVAPVAWITLMFCLPLEGLPLRARRAVTTALLAALSVGPSYWLGNTLVRHYLGSEVFCPLPGLRGVLIRSAQLSELQAGSRVVSRALLENRDVFVLSSQAAVYYLVTNARNPTPFDYPLESGFSRTGRTRILSALARGEIRSVVIDHGSYSHPFMAALEPVWIEQAARARLSCSIAPGNWELCRSGTHP